MRLRRPAFTLIELLVVIAIIAILIGLLSMSLTRTNRALVGLALSLLLAGCANTPKTGTVTGRVTLGGMPAEGVALTFQGADGRTATAMTDAEGKYRAYLVPVGTVRVGVATLPTEQEAADTGMIQKNMGSADEQTRAKKARETPKKMATKVPERYADPGSSGFTHTVTEGETTFDIPLTK
jgi:prepilin-type N-terminal cleavage/methylation domain-containing protein